MTADSDQVIQERALASHEPPRRTGSIVLVLVVAGSIVAVAVALMAIGRAQAQPYILGLLALSEVAPGAPRNIWKRKSGRDQGPSANCADASAQPCE